MTTYAFKDREYWAARKVGDKYIRTTLKCTGCGYRAPHFQADYNAELHLFTVPYAGLNGGVGAEYEADYPRTTDLDDVLLSSCCYMPNRPNMLRLMKGDQS